MLVGAASSSKSTILKNLRESYKILSEKHSKNQVYYSI